MRAGLRRDETGEPEGEPAENDRRAVRDEPDLGWRRAEAHPQFDRAEPLSGPVAYPGQPGDQPDVAEGTDPLLATCGYPAPANDAQPCWQPRRGRGQSHQPPQHPDRRRASAGYVHNPDDGCGDGAGVKPAHPVIASAVVTRACHELTCGLRNASIIAAAGRAAWKR